MAPRIIEVVQPGYMEDPSSGEGALRLTIEGGGDQDVRRVLLALLAQTDATYGGSEAIILDGEQVDPADLEAIEVRPGTVVIIGAWEHRVDAPVAA